mgnify:CR=1 FL=1
MSMAEKQDIAMNAFKLLTDAAYLYGEATDSSQGKIEKDVFINIVKRYITSIRSKGGIPDSDLNNIYKNEDPGISIYDIVTGILNSPATYSFCINIQRSDKLLPKELFKLFQETIRLICERGKVMEKRLFIHRGGKYKLLIIEQFIHSTFSALSSAP